MAQSCVTFLQVTEAENVGCLLQVRVALNQKKKIAIILHIIHRAVVRSVCSY